MKQKLAVFQVVTLFIAASALVATSVTCYFIYRGTDIAQSDYAARTRPYLGIKDVAVQGENDNSVYLAINMTNYGEVPATNVELGQMTVVAGPKGVGTDIVYIWVMGTSDTIVFPEKPFLTVISVDKTDYEETVVTGEALTIGLTYSCGERSYWYEATATLQADDKWVIGHERAD